MADSASIEIDPTHLVGRLRELETETEGDLARIIELLLLENHVLRQHQSVGFTRNAHYGFFDFPRFLRLDDEAADDDSRRASEEDDHPQADSIETE